MLSWKTRAKAAFKQNSDQAAPWMPAVLQRMLTSFSGSDPMAAQLLRTLFWQYRYLVLLALLLNIAAAIFEGSSMAILTIALDGMAGAVGMAEVQGEMGWLGNFVQSWRNSLGTDTFFLILILLAVSTQIIRSGLQFGGRVATSYLIAWSEGDLRRQIFRQCMTISYPQISRYKLGDLSSYIEQVNQIGTLLMAINTMVSHFFIMIAYAFVLLWISWPMTVAALVALLLLSSSLQGIMRNIHKISRHYVNIGVSFTENVLEYLHGLRLIHTFAREQYAIAQVETIINEGVRARRQSIIWSSIITPLAESITIIGVAVFLIANYLLADQQGTSIAQMVTFIIVLYRLLPRISTFNGYMGSINSYTPFAARVAEILRKDDKQYVISGNQPFTRFQDKLEFDNISLRYADQEQPAIQNLSFTVKRGQLVAFVGGSGAGKSTIVNLLLRLYEPTGGQIRIDGANLSTFGVQDWRNQTAVVDQDPFIFNASVAENIRFGKLDASDEEIREAAKIANADEFIRELSHGYDTVVGDRGYRVSGGQRQRLAIARAVLRDPEFLILDEATSALDSHSERLIQQSIEDLRQTRTVIVIAHRLSTIMRADQIFVLEQGQLLEQGTHTELLAKHGRYAHLWSLQGTSESENNHTA